MAATDDGETLESLLNRATSTMNQEDDWEYILNFCDRVNLELEGVQISTKLLIYKLQSPQEREALQAVTVLQACVKNCGVNFHRELGKYRFLNELIKLVSPKYLGTKTSKKVQEKIISMLYTWSVALADQTKIRDAYQMLKKQGIITADPPYDQSLITNFPSKSEERDSFFNDEEKRVQLDKLLKSRRPEDLQAANRLIKSVVKEDEAKMEKLKKRCQTLEEVSNNIKLFNEMLSHFNPDESSVADMQMMKELYEGCQTLRPSLFRLASDTDDDETALMDILGANDDVSKAMQLYEKTVQPKLTSVTDRKADGAAEPAKPIGRSVPAQEESNLLDLTGLNLTSQATSSGSNNGNVLDALTPNLQSSSKIGATSDVPLFNFTTDSTKSSDVNNLFVLDGLASSSSFTTAATPVLNNQIPKLPSPPQPKQEPKSVFADIDELSRGLMEKSLGSTTRASFPEPPLKPTLNELSKPVSTVPPPNQNKLANIFDVPSSSFVAIPPTANPPLVAMPTAVQLNPLSISSSPTPTILPLQTAPLTPHQDFSLNDVSVSLESIRPSTFTPVTAYDKNGIRVMLHFAKDHATPARTDTLVSVVSIMSTRTSPVTNIIFQAAAPKIMKVKLQSPSNSVLPAFNPIFSAPPVTQVMVIANPSQKDVKIRYKLEYKIDDQSPISDTGMMTGFPPPDKWGNL